MFARLISMSQDLSIINRSYDLYKSISITTHDLPKRWRYGLGTSLEASVLDFIDQLIMAKHAPKSLKVSYLIKAQAQLEITTLKLRLLLDLKLTNETRIFQAQAKLAEIGRMLGGWKKSLA